MTNPEKRFRLRKGEQIVGYMRKVSPTMILYSRDGFWWRGFAIEYDELDEYIGFRDRNNRYIYEWDILEFKIDPDGDYSQGVILWEAKEQVFGIKAIEEGSFIPLFIDDIPMFNPRELKVYSHLYLNPELKAELKVKD